MDPKCYPQFFFRVPTGIIQLLKMKLAIFNPFWPRFYHLLSPKLRHFLNVQICYFFKKNFGWLPTTHPPRTSRKVPGGLSKGSFLDLNETGGNAIASFSFAGLMFAGGKLPVRLICLPYFCRWKNACLGLPVTNCQTFKFPVVLLPVTAIYR